MAKKVHPGTTSLNLVFSFLLLAFTACHNSPEKTSVSETSASAVPAFSGDSAYAFTKAQVDFGPRTPGSMAHEECGNYIVAKLKAYGFEVIEQKASATTYDNKHFTIRNIIGSYKPALGNRVLLLAHWDTRPFASKDSTAPDKPADGAVDGASGVAVLLEIARNFHKANPEIGIDLLFDDLEDYGQEENSGFPDKENTWCLGTQYWAKHPHKEGYTASYGVLLDMVGGNDPVYPKEGLSMKFAPQVTDKIWSIAAGLGYGNNFIDENGGTVTDDHYYVNEWAKIPTVDIIPMDPQTGQFPFYHHRHSDNMSNVNAYSLEMTGKVLLETLFSK